LIQSSCWRMEFERNS